jgi:hypothetical protein
MTSVCPEHVVVPVDIRLHIYFPRINMPEIGPQARAQVNDLSC